MRCPRCWQSHEVMVAVCSCGFQFDQVGEDELDGWFAEVRGVLEKAYVAAETPWQGSGKSGTFEEWTRLRVPNIGPVDREGRYLDIGCANGYLLACLVAWGMLKGVRIVPYGLDYSERLVGLARERLPDFRENFFVGNGWDWVGEERFDYVRTELDYVPKNYRRAYVERLAEKLVAPGGKLLISQYRSRREDLGVGWVEEELVAWGWRVMERYEGYSEAGLALCRVVVVG
ncbi:MAG TPA: class I SAM-dependent methyltransferase [Anaerolineae bacterium]|nr:class I SAM-dependent methyltransferase [Anaerolineae bacterium]